MKIILAVVLLPVAFAQINVGGGGGGGGGASVSAGAGITVAGSTVSADTAVMLSRATAQAGTSTKCATSTSTSAPVCSSTPTLTAYTDGMVLLLAPHATFSAAATLNVDTVGAKKLYKMSSGTPAQIGASDIVSTGKYLILYSSALDSSAGGWLVVPLEGGSAGALTKSGPYFTDGSNYYFGPSLMTAYRPSLLTLSWVNQGTSSVAGTGYETMTSVQGSSGHHARVATLSATNVEAWFISTAAIEDAQTTEGCSLVLRESSTQKTLVAMAYNNSNYVRLFSGYYTGDGTGFGGDTGKAPPVWLGSIYGFKATLSGGTWTLYYSSGSIDGSGNPLWAPYGSVAATTAFTTAANQFGYNLASPPRSGASSYCTALSLRSY